MDVVERLTIEEASEPTLIALTHVHRYQVAAELCADLRVLDLPCGSGYGSRILAGSARKVTGIDIHAPSIERASADAGGDPKLRFECADAHDVLERDLAGEFDAIVMFEGLEHLADLEASTRMLARHVASGLMVVASLPNSIPFAEENPHHVSQFDFERARDVFERIGATTLLYQFHGEGSLIRSAEDGPLHGASTMPERAELEHCNHLLAIANPPAGFVEGGAWARMRLGVAPSPNTYILDLERANERLWRTNQELAREKIGIADSAAAAALDRIRNRAATAPSVPSPGLLGRAAARIKRALTLVVPHGLVLLRMRLRDRERDDR